MHTRAFAVASTAVLAATAAHAPPAVARSPVVVELFTSESCSSCPPADALLAQLAATRPDVLALDWHVTYWDRLGWKDPWSLPAATARQNDYARQFGDDDVYTPEAVVDGQSGLVGSNEPALLAAIARREAGREPSPALGVAPAPGGTVAVSVGAGIGTGRVLLLGVDPSHDTTVGGGENDGRRLHEVDVVRSVAAIGRWTGAALTFRVAAPEGERPVVLLQDDRGRIEAAAAEPATAAAGADEGAPA